MTITRSFPRSVHLDQSLVERLFALVVTSPGPAPRCRPHRVDFIDEHDAGGVFLRLVEHVANTRSAHADDISTKSEPEIEKNGTFASPAMRAASSVFPVPGLPTISTPLGGDAAPPAFWKLGGIAAEIDQLGNFILGLFAPATSAKVNVVVLDSSIILGGIFRTRRRHPSAALHLAHEKSTPDEEGHREPRRRRYS